LDVIARSVNRRCGFPTGPVDIRGHTGRACIGSDPNSNSLEHVNVDEDIGCVAVARVVAMSRECGRDLLLNESGTNAASSPTSGDNSISRFNDAA